MRKAVMSETAFPKGIKDVLENSMNFEKCSSFVRYDYEDSKKSVGTALNLCFQTNHVMDIIVPYLKSKSEVNLYTEDQAKPYYGRPMALSYDTYGATDYWWIILAVNGYFNPVEFTGWTQLVIPEINEIERILDREIYVNDNIGEIPTKLVNSK